MNSNQERKGRILNIILGIFLVLWIITTAVLILPAWRNYRNIRAEEDRQRALLDAAKVERQRQLERQHRLKTSPAEVEKVARETYKFVGEGETVMSYPKEKKTIDPKAEKKSKKSGKSL